ncbi:OmpA family protein [Elongatibacter sediminis]|uniref:OmpA family protein n=1 Tax=Elongatibacter sediminis TaxID=3119006 RepID=A0AAW9R760_9GAMM
MKISKSITAVSVAVLALGSAPTHADGDQPWHFTYQIGGASLDSARNTRDGDTWHSIGFGRFFGDNLSLDFEYDEFEATYRDFDTVVPGATYDDWKLSTYGLMARYHFGEKTLRPFVGAGLGRTKHRSVLDEDTNTGISVALGVAGQMAKHWSMRAQVMWRNDYDSGSLPPRGHFKDFFYSVGLSYDFGGVDAPPPPPPAKPAAPPPPPPNPDLDGDGVPNERDKCPNTRPGAVVDLDGCEVEAVISLENVHFDFDKATLRPEAIVILNDAAKLLNTHERVVVEVAGHTDSVGTEQYNQGLSERRANAVRDYLVNQGVRASRLTARGYGELQPVATNDTSAGRQMNRRVELIVLDR